MREIKFRGRRLDNGEWIYGNLTILKERYFISFQELECVVKEEVSPKTVGQFTGLKDLNDKEIYEGDVLEIIGEDGTLYQRLNVYHDGEYFSMCLSGTWIGTGMTITMFKILYPELKIIIIGNIHDNPELLKVK